MLIIAIIAVTKVILVIILIILIADLERPSATALNLLVAALDLKFDQPRDMSRKKCPVGAQLMTCQHFDGGPSCSTLPCNCFPEN